MALRLAGKTAVITGAGSGINLSFAQLLLQKGCNVLFADLALRPEAKSLISQYSSTSSGLGRAVFLQTDVKEWSQLSRMFETVNEEFNGADIVCPGAGVFEPDSINRSSYATLDINITHPIRVTQLAISHFVARKRPDSIVHISSIAGQEPFFPCPLYSTSKHAINGFVRSLASLEHPPPDLSLPVIRVVAVAPGVVRTPLWLENEEKMKLVGEATEEWATPEMVARVMVDLVEKNEYEGGTVLEVGKRGQTRRVQVHMDPGPSGGEYTPLNELEESRDIWRRLMNDGGVGI